MNGKSGAPNSLLVASIPINLIPAPTAPLPRGGLTCAQTSSPDRTTLRPGPWAPAPSQAKDRGNQPPGPPGGRQRRARGAGGASGWRRGRAAAGGTAARGSHRGAETRPGYLRAGADAARSRNGCTPPGAAGGAPA